MCRDVIFDYAKDSQYLSYSKYVPHSTAIDIGLSSPRRMNCSHDETVKLTPPCHNPFLGLNSLKSILVGSFHADDLHQ